MLNTVARVGLSIAEPTTRSVTRTLLWPIFEIASNDGVSAVTVVLTFGLNHFNQRDCFLFREIHQLGFANFEKIVVDLLARDRSALVAGHQFSKWTDS